MKKFLGAFLAFSAMLFLQSANASAATRVWDGGASDNGVGTAANWVGDQVPIANDVLVFPQSMTQTVHFDSSIEFATLMFGDDSSATGGSTSYNYTITGTPHARMIYAGEQSVGSVEFAPSSTLTLTYPGAGINEGSVYVYGGSAIVEIVGNVIFDNLAQLDINGGAGGGILHIEPVSATGQIDEMIVRGAIQAQLGGVTTASIDQLNIAETSTDYEASVFFLNPAWQADNTLVRSHGGIVVTDGLTLTKPISFQDNTELYYTYSAPTEGDPITLSGDITLAGNTAWRPVGFNGELRLTGNVSGAGKIVLSAGYGSDLVVQPAAGKTNTSQNKTGTTSSDIRTVTVTDSNTNTLTVQKNNLVIVNGQRGSTTVNAGGILKGSGTVGALNVENGGVVAPGQSPGCLTSGNLTLAGTYVAELNGKTACTEHDQLIVNGTVNLAGSTLDLDIITTFKPTAGDTYTILNNDGNDAITGTFTGLAQGASVTVDGYTFTVSYTGGDGNDVVLTLTSIAPGAAGTTPGTPKTGFGLVSANPLATFALTSISAVGLYIVSRKFGAKSYRR